MFVCDGFLYREPALEPPPQPHNSSHLCSMQGHLMGNSWAEAGNYVCSYNAAFGLTKSWKLTPPSSLPAAGSISLGPRNQWRTADLRKCLETGNDWVVKIGCCTCPALSPGQHCSAAQAWTEHVRLWSQCGVADADHHYQGYQGYQGYTDLREGLNRNVKKGRYSYSANGSWRLSLRHFNFLVVCQIHIYVHVRQLPFCIFANLNEDEWKFKWRWVKIWMKMRENLNEDEGKFDWRWGKIWMKMR